MTLEVASFQVALPVNRVDIRLFAVSKRLRSGQPTLGARRAACKRCAASRVPPNKPLRLQTSGASLPVPATPERE